MVSTETGAVTLRVAKASPRDVGRAIARIDPNDMKAIGVEVGDVVQLAGKRVSPARVMPTYPQDRGKGIVQVDGIVRENTQSALGEQVRVERAEAHEAISVLLERTTSSGAAGLAEDVKSLGRVFEGVPVSRADRIRATLLGGRYQEFSVVEVSPEGIVVITDRTRIKVRGGSVGGEKTGDTYEDVGALRKEVQRIREMVEIPLRYPELFERLGIDAPRGVLLYGPPGCGKTLIARAVANETDAAFFHVSGPEIIQKFYGESEANLRAIFDRASAKAPAIIFIDEIDAIASRRDEVRGDQQVERRVVAQLLALMDGLRSRGQVIVIGATNMPQILDPALRRPGRFDREIAISVPDRNGRLEILQIHTRGMPLTEDVRLEHLAEITHGFVGADLEVLCREAAMTTLRRVMPSIELDAIIDSDLLEKLEVSMDDFQDALREVEPSAIREVFTEIPDVQWDDVGGLEEIKQTLMETIVWPQRYPQLFRQVKTSPPKGILLSGLPGTGKTLLAKAVASQSGVNFISVKGPALLSRWVGESEKGVREVFRKAKLASPCIVFFDEIDALTPARGSGDSHVTERVISQFLTELDGIEDLKGVTVLAATNRPDIIDPALLRTGRFDIQIELPLPDEAARLRIFHIHSAGKPLAADVDLAGLAAATDGLVGSDIEAICRRASMLAIREFVGGSTLVASSPEALDLALAGRHFGQALQEVGARSR